MAAVLDIDVGGPREREREKEVGKPFLLRCVEPHLKPTGHGRSSRDCFANFGCKCLPVLAHSRSSAPQCSSRGCDSIERKGRRSSPKHSSSRSRPQKEGILDSSRNSKSIEVCFWVGRKETGEEEGGMFNSLTGGDWSERGGVEWRRMYAMCDPVKWAVSPGCLCSGTDALNGA